MEYPKINSLWKRQGWYFEEGKKTSKDYQDGRQSSIVGDYARDEFSNIKTWHVTEKIDGTNIRIGFLQKFGQRCKPDIMGRTAAAQLPKFLVPVLEKIASWERIDEAMARYNDANEIAIKFDELTLFGEGYGPKIQSCGGNYRSDPGFILFDVLINERWWLTPQNVAKMALCLGVPSVPVIGTSWSENEIVEYVKSKPKSLCSKDEQMMEGVVARAYPTVYFANGQPVMFKLKCKEF